MIAITTLIAVFSLGLTAGFSPCIFPVLPAFIAFLTESENKWWKGVLAGILVTAGIITVFTILGVIFSRVIGFLSIYYNTFRQIQGILLIVLGFLLIKSITFNFSILNKLNTKSQNLFDYKNMNHWLSAYLLGLLFAFLAAPCAIIPFATLFTFLLTESVIGSTLLMLIFSFGTGISFVLMGFLVPAFKNNTDNAFKKFQLYIPKIAGVIIILIGFLLILEANAIV